MTAQNSNIVFSYWKYKNSDPELYLNSHNKSIENKVNHLIDSINHALFDSKLTIKEAFNNLFDYVFSLRIKSSDFVKDKELKIEEIFDSIYTKFEERIVPEEFEVLNENVLFSIRTTSKIAKKIIQNNETSNIINSFDELTKHPIQKFSSKTPYKEMINSLKHMAHFYPNKSLIQLIELINSSFNTELGIISSDIIF